MRWNFGNEILCADFCCGDQFSHHNKWSFDVKLLARENFGGITGDLSLRRHSEPTFANVHYEDGENFVEYEHGEYCLVNVFIRN